MINYMQQIDQEDLARELEFHIRLINTRFGKKLTLIAQRMLSDFDEESIESLVENSLAHFGMSLLIVPQDIDDASKVLEQQKKEINGQIMNNLAAESLANLPQVIPYPFHFCGDPLEIRVLKCIDRMDHYIFQFFEHAKLDTIVFSNDLAKMDPRYIQRNMIYTSEFTRDYIITSLLNMTGYD